MTRHVLAALGTGAVALALGFWFGRASAPRVAPAVRWTLPPVVAPESRPAWLARRVPDTEFNGVTLQDALDYLSETSQVTLALEWDELRNAGAEPYHRISFNARGLTLGQALEGVLQRVKTGGKRLDYREESYGVRVGAQSHFDLGDGVESRAYDLRELLLGAARYGRGLDELAARRGVRAPGPPAWQRESLSHIEGNQFWHLRALVEATVFPESQQRLDHEAVHYLAGWLVVHTTAPRHERIAALLRELNAEAATRPAHPDALRLPPASPD